MVKRKSTILISIIMIAIITFSLFTCAIIANFGGRSFSGDTPEVGEYNASSNVKLDDDNGKVPDGGISSDGVAIGSEQELKDFLMGTAAKGYLVADIPSFCWTGVGSGVEFGKDRELNGNGYKVTFSLERSSDQYRIIDNFIKLDWRSVTKEHNGDYAYNQIFATSPFVAVNQGSIKNVNFVGDFVPNSANPAGFLYEWVPMKNRGTDEGTRVANTQPLSFGFVSGVNFGDIDNCTFDYVRGSNLRIQTLGNDHLARYSKENRNHIEAGGFAGCNAGNISNVTVNHDGYIEIFARSSNRDYGVGISSGKAQARSMYGGVVGKMQSDPYVSINKVGNPVATLYNSVVKGNGTIKVAANSCGTGSQTGLHYQHPGVAVGGNSQYAGTVVDKQTGQNFGQIDGVISTFNGSIPMGGDTWTGWGSTSGGVSAANAHRSMVDCGKISNVTFLDNYDGHIDGCQCVGGEHIATRANGIKATFGDSDVTVKFDNTDEANATLIFTVTPRKIDGMTVNDDIIFATGKNNKMVDGNSNIRPGKIVPMYNYDSDNYYAYDSSGNNNSGIVSTAKSATFLIQEPRYSDDSDFFTLETQIGKRVKAVYATATDGLYQSFDDKLGAAIDTFPYDGQEKGTAKITGWNDADGVDTILENKKYCQFRSKFRMEDENLADAKDFTLAIVYPGVYTDIYLLATESSRQAYVDPEQRLIGALNTKPGDDNSLITSSLKITPANMTAVDEDPNFNKGGADYPNDVDADKLGKDFLSKYGFKFSVYSLMDSIRTELVSKIIGSGGESYTVFPYDRIEYTHDGYTFNTAITIIQKENGIEFVYNDTTGIDGMPLSFRARKEIKDENGKVLMTNTVAIDPTEYILKIDGKAPIITATVQGQGGVNYEDWSDKKKWKAEAFTLNFIVEETTLENLRFYSSVNGNDPSEIALDSSDGLSKATIAFGNSDKHVFYATDKYGNKSVEYVVEPMVDTYVPSVEIKAVMENEVHDNGMLKVNGVEAINGAPITINETLELQNSRSTFIRLDFGGQLISSGYTITYSINGGTALRATNDQILCDRMFNPEYFKDGVDKANIYDNYDVTVTTGAGNVILLSNIEVQINKGLIEIDKDKVEIPDGGWIEEGIQPHHLMKNYTGDDTLPIVLITALTEAVNREVEIIEGKPRAIGDRLTVGGYYFSTNVGENIDLIIDVIDPLGIFTIDASRLNLEGKINPAQINVTVNSMRREYGEKDPVFTYKVVGLLGNDKVDLSGLIHPIRTPSESLKAPVGKYGIVVPSERTIVGNGGENKNYSIMNINHDAELIVIPKVLNFINYEEDYLTFGYNGQEHRVVATYTKPDGSISELDVEYYAVVNGEDKKIANAPIEMGEYKAKFIIRDVNYTLEDSRAILGFTVGEGVVGVDLPSDKLNLKYNGTPRSVNPILSNGATPIIMYYDSNGLLMSAKPENAGTYRVRVQYNNDDDVEEAQGKYGNVDNTYTMVISKITYKELNVNLSNIDKTYDGKMSQIILANVPRGTVIPEEILKRPGIEPNTYIVLEATDAGLYNANFSLSNPNVEGGYFEVQININKATYASNKVELTNNQAKYDGKPHYIELLNLPTDTTVSTVIGTTSGVEVIDNKVTMTEAGEYTVILSLKNKNFVAAQLSSILGITPAEMSGVEVGALKLTYDGKAHSTKLSGIPSDLLMKSETRVEVFFGSKEKYVLSRDTDANADHTEWTIPSRTMAGIHGFRVLVYNNNYVRKILNSTIQIDKASYSSFGVRIDDVEYDYDGAEKTLNITGLPSGTIVTSDGVNVIDGFVKGADAGVYGLSVRLVNNNFIDMDSTISGKMTINKAVCDKDYTLSAVSKDYDGESSDIVFDTSTLREGATFKFVEKPDMVISGNKVSIKDAGNYTVEMIVSHKNYLDKTVTANAVINKIAAPYKDSISIDDLTTPYDGKIKKPIIVGIEGYEPAVSVVYSEIVFNNSPINVGEYHGKVTVSHRNYIDIVDDYVLVITKAIMNLSDYTIESKAYEYDGKQKSVTIIDSNGAQLGAEYNIIWKYGTLEEGVRPINAGVYIVTARITRDNYEDYLLPIEKNGELLINKIESPELKLGKTNFAFNGKEQKVEVKRVDGKDMGAYVIEYYISGVKTEIVNAGVYNCKAVISQINYANVEFDTTVEVKAIEVEVLYTGIKDTVAGKEMLLKGTYTDVNGETKEVEFVYPEGFDPTNPIAGKYVAKAKFPMGNYVASVATAEIEFTVKTAHVAAIAGGTVGGAVLASVSVGLFFILKKKKIKL